MATSVLNDSSFKTLPQLPSSFNHFAIVSAFNIFAHTPSNKHSAKKTCLYSLAKCVCMVTMHSIPVLADFHTEERAKHARSFFLVELTLFFAWVPTSFGSLLHDKYVNANSESAMGPQSFQRRASLTENCPTGLSIFTIAAHVFFRNS